MRNRLNKIKFSQLAPLNLAIILLLVSAAQNVAASGSNLTQTVNYDVSITQFGAVANDNQDDAGAIQQAIDSVPESGGTVRVPAGVFHISRTINFHKSKTTLTGVGVDSVIKFLPNVIAPMLEMPQFNLAGNPYNLVTPRDNTITKLRFDGNKNHDPSPWQPETSVFGLLIRQSERLTISEVTVHDIAEDGIAIGNGQLVNKDLVLKNSHVYRIGRNGIHLGQGDGLRVSRVHVEDTPSQQWGPAAGSGIDIEVEGTYPNVHVKNAVIEDSVIERENTLTAGDGVAVQPAYGPIENVIIKNNVIRNHQYGVEIPAQPVALNKNSWVRNITIENNIIVTDNLRASGGGIISNNAANLKLLNNTIVNVNGNYHWGTSINGISPDAVVSGNKFLNQKGCGVKLNGSSKIVVSNNQYLTCPLEKAESNNDTIVSGNVDLPIGAIDLTPPSAFLNLRNKQIIAKNSSISFHAADSGSGIFKTFYFFDGVPLGSVGADERSSFTIDFSRYAPGTHVLSLFAIDRHGNISKKSAAKIVTAAAGNATVLDFDAPHDNAFAPPADGLVGYWKFNEGSGTTVIDSSPNKMHGKLTVGPQGDQTQIAQAWANGDSPLGGNGIYFDNVDDAVSIPNHAAHNPGAGDYTFAFWLKWVGNCDSFVVWKDYAIDFKIGPNYGCKMVARIGGGEHYVTSQELDQGWSHFALTLSRGGSLILYQNGAKVGERSSNGLPATVSNKAPLNLGNLMNGAIDELVIYNRALTAAEVATLAALKKIALPRQASPQLRRSSNRRD